MAEDPEDIDQFLYGDEANFLQSIAEGEAVDANSPAATEEVREDGESVREDGEEEESEEEEDDFEIVLDGKQEPALKKGQAQVALPTATTGATAASVKPVVDVNAPGVLNGEVIYNVELDSLPEKPWRQPGADITEYFNYGFTEQSWREYCLKQRTLREEYGAPKKIAVFDGTALPMVPPGMPMPPPVLPPGVLPPGIPPFPFPPGIPLPPFPFPPGMAPPPMRPVPVESDDRGDRGDDRRDRDRDRDRDSRRTVRRRSRSRSPSRERESKRRR